RAAFRWIGDRRIQLRKSTGADWPEETTPPGPLRLFVFKPGNIDMSLSPRIDYGIQTVFGSSPAGHPQPGHTGCGAYQSALEGCFRRRAGKDRFFIAGKSEGSKPDGFPGPALRSAKADPGAHPGYCCRYGQCSRPSQSLGPGAVGKVT